MYELDLPVHGNGHGQVRKAPAAPPTTRPTAPEPTHTKRQCAACGGKDHAIHSLSYCSCGAGRSDEQKRTLERRPDIMVTCSSCNESIAGSEIRPLLSMCHGCGRLRSEEEVLKLAAGGPVTCTHRDCGRTVVFQEDAFVDTAMLVTTA